uniref:MTSS1-like protein n=1 Tax=Sinocyclocheilus grahami TaxID=75366 RepID=A0A672PQ80_SINGR
MESVEKECGALGGLFQAIVNDMKYSYPVWEDFIAKATKLHSQLRTTLLAVAAFLDAFQKVADMATNTRGATRDIGSTLTRMCMRHRSIEAKLRHFTNALMEKMIAPLQDKIEEWKKTAALLDKDHAKEYKRSRQEIKKKSSDTIKLQKKARKGRGGLKPQLDSAMQDVSDMYLLMEETEKQAVRRALLEERGRYCTFISFLQPVVIGEIAMLGEATHLQAIIDDLTVLTTDPHKLPEASEQVILDLKGSDYNWSYQTPPSSPSSVGSRKSSLCRCLSRRFLSQQFWVAFGYSYLAICYLVHLPPGGAHRLSSVSSHDSGFVSQDANVHSKPPSPMPSDITSQKSSSSASSEASETCQSVSECGSPTVVSINFSQEMPLINYLINYELAMVLTRGLSIEQQQKSSCDSLQYSSGYSTQNTTPSCSEDTIPSQGSEYDCYSMNGDADNDAQTDFNKSCTVPRHSNLAQNYRRMIQTKRPASTAGLHGALAAQGAPTTNGKGGGSGVIASGTATIRRTPSSKTNVRRTPSSVGPIPIRPPIVPVKTPTVPDSPEFPSPPPEHTGSEENLYNDESLEILDYKASPKRMSLPTWGAGGGSVYAQQTGAAGFTSEEEQMLAANRHSLVEKIGELVANAHALGEGQFPFPTDPRASQGHQQDQGHEQDGGDMLKTIRRGVRLRKATCNDRSAPRILR